MPCIVQAVLSGALLIAGATGPVLRTVRYAHWGYSQHLVLVRLNQVWEVRRIVDNEHWHTD